MPTTPPPVAAEISIHALRVEGDPRPLFYSSPPSNFYPRPPGGGRLRVSRGKYRRIEISIHALRVEGDSATQGCREWDP